MGYEKARLHPGAPTKRVTSPSPRRRGARRLPRAAIERIRRQCPQHSDTRLHYAPSLLPSDAKLKIEHKSNAHPNVRPIDRLPRIRDERRIRHHRMSICGQFVTYVTQNDVRRAMN